MIPLFWCEERSGQIKLRLAEGFHCYGWWTWNIFTIGFAYRYFYTLGRCVYIVIPTSWMRNFINLCCSKIVAISTSVCFYFSCFLFPPCFFLSPFIQVQLLSYLFSVRLQLEVQQNRYSSLLSHAFCYCHFTKVWLTFMLWYLFLKEHSIWGSLPAILLYISTVPVEVVIFGVSCIVYFGMNFCSRCFTCDCSMALFLSNVEVFKFSRKKQHEFFPCKKLYFPLTVSLRTAVTFFWSFPEIWPRIEWFWQS